MGVKRSWGIVGVGQTRKSYDPIFMHLMPLIVLTIKDLSEMNSASRSTNPKSDARVTISTKEFELLRHKVEESNKLADMKVAAAMAQVEAVKARENEALKTLEATQKDINDMKTTTQEAMTMR